MPPPYRQPSQVGATAATKRPFKTPVITKGSGVTSSSSGGTTLTSHQSKPTKTAAAAAAASAVATNPQTTWNTTNTTKPTGFQSAIAQMDTQDLEALLIDDSDDDDDNEDDEDDEFSALTTKTTTTTKRPATTAEQSPNKRQKSMPTRLPSLSPMSSSLPKPLEQQQQHPTTATTVIGTSKDNIPLLPSALLTRLLHESLENKTSTKIGKQANALTARYLDLFVREAVARAVEVAKERKEMREAGGEGVQDIWLEVQDLEEVAPGLVIDF
jgi:histone H3/H4